MKTQMHMWRIVVLGLAVFPFCSSYAQEADAKTLSQSVPREAAQLLKQGRYEEACGLLDTVSVDDPQLQFMRGQCRFGMQDFASAAFQYQLMLERNTNLPRVRLELARTLAAMGKSKAAREEYESVLRGKLPETVRQNIVAQLQRLDERRRWGGVYSLGYMHDSNVNSAPADPNILAFGLPFVLDRGSTEKSDNAWLGSLAFGKYFDGPVADEWRYDVFANFQDYASLNAFDNYSLGFSLGPNFYGNQQVYIPLGVSYSWEDGKSAANSISLSPSISGAISQRLRASAQWSVQYQNDLRPSDEAYGWIQGIAGNFQYSLDPANMLELGLSYQANNANKFDYNRFRSSTLSLGWHTAFGNGVRLSLQPSYTWARYDDDDPVDAGVVRKDDRYGINANLYGDTKIGDFAFTPVLSINLRKNASNIARRDYERTQISFFMRKQF